VFVWQAKVQTTPFAAGPADRIRGAHVVLSSMAIANQKYPARRVGLVYTKTSETSFLSQPKKNHPKKITKKRSFGDHYPTCVGARPLVAMTRFSPSNLWAMVCATFWKIMAIFVKNETICSFILSLILHLNGNKCSTFTKFGRSPKNHKKEEVVGTTTQLIWVPAHWL